MKKNLHVKQLAVLFIFVLGFSMSVLAQKKQIVYVYDASRTDLLTNESPEMPVVKALRDSGYQVDLFPTFVLSNATAEQIDSLNKANLVYIGRAIGSGNFGGGNEVFWHAIKAPIMTSNMWGLRSGGRMGVFETTGAGNDDATPEAILEASILEPNDPVFSHLTSQTIGWWIGPRSTLQSITGGNGKIMAIRPENNEVLFVRFEANVAFFEGTTAKPAGPRVYMGNASDNAKDAAGNQIFNYFAYTDDSKKVFFKEVARLAAIGGTSKVDNLNQSTLKVYPNPAKSNLTIAMQNMEKVEIFNVTGKLVYTMTSSNNQLTINVSQFERGVYFAKISNQNNQSLVRKITLN